MTTDNQYTINVLTYLHDLSEKSQVCEEMLTESLIVFRAMDEAMAAPYIEYNEMLLSTLMSQRILLAKFAEYGMLVDDVLDKVRATIIDPQPE